jgi:uncharacterized protein YkwD
MPLPRLSPRVLRRVGPALLLSAVLSSGLLPTTRPTPVLAATATTIEDQLLGWINASRTRLGLVPLRSHAGLRDLAGDRAAVMASTGVLSHTIAGCLSCQLNARGIQWYMEGETIAWTSYPWGDQAASYIFNWWKHSSGHWALLMSNRFNYIGVGVAYRSANATTWASAVLTESVDYSRPWARVRSGSGSGTTASWSWYGGDLWLQTHTSGFRNYDIQYRIDSGTWTTIRSGTTTTSLSLTGRPHGHYYGLRARSRDWRGYVSYWTAEKRVWIP